MPEPLDGISQSPEAQITQAFFAVLKADSLLASAFKPILLIESPTREAFDELTVYTMAVVPFRLRIVDHPNDRQTIYMEVIVSAYLPKEPTEQDSVLRGLDLGNHIRKIAYSNADLAGIAFDAVDFAYLVSLQPKDTGVRILSFLTTFQSDIAPTTGLFL